MHTNVKLLLSALALSTCVACGDDDLEIIEQPLQGEINGEAWELKHGFARLDESEGTVSVTLLNIEVADGFECSAPFDSGPKILFFRDAKVGSGSLSLRENITFSYDSEDGPENAIATDGTWRFDEVTEDKIVGGLAAEFEGHNVNGTFELVRCPDPFAN